MLSVIIPTLNAASSLPQALAALAPARARGLIGEMIVVDGGSADATLAVAARAGARVVQAPRGRGGQLAAGAAVADGEWLLFLHADTMLADGWIEAVRAFIARPGNRERAAVFRFALDDDAPVARRLERIVAWRTTALGLPYGDQGLLIARDFYRAVGGFRALPLMEDVDIVRRIGRARLAVLDAAAVTAATRYRRSGYLGRSLRNILCLGLYFLGVPPRSIARLYG